MGVTVKKMIAGMAAWLLPVIVCLSLSVPSAAQTVGGLPSMQAEQTAASIVTDSLVFGKGAPETGAAPKVRIERVEDAFFALPDSAMDLLNVGERMDMVDRYKAGTDRNDTTVRVLVNRIDTIAGDYMKVRLTRVSDVQLKLLPLGKGKGQMLAVVYTIGSDRTAGDSRISFYQVQGDTLAAMRQKKIFRSPDVKDFFSLPKDAELSMSEIETLVPFPTVVYTFSPDDADNTLTARLTVGEYMVPDDYKEIKRYERDALPYFWNGKEFKLKKAT